mmetsp:Transcript_6074/g.10307  ORF Transcript_6074/g.10307 Transcript_6074/m.10307 type:complete len:148 (-) Transcript_6074:200-643(-)
MPFLGSEQVCKQENVSFLIRTKKGFQLKRWTATQAASPLLLKQLLQRGPVATQIRASSPLFKFYSGGVIDDTSLDGPLECAGEPNHAVTVVGFGRDRDTEKDFFIVKNSFGEDWGLRGYVKIAALTSPGLSLGSCSILSFLAQPEEL